MPRQVVIFDTNVYRQLGPDRIAAIRLAERSRGMVAYAHCFVILELLAHLADQEDEQFDYCWRAVRSMWEHCSLFNGSRYYLPQLPDPDTHLAPILFGKPMPSHAWVLHLYDGTVKRIAQAATRDDFAGLNRVLRRLADHVANVEEQFVGHFAQYAVEDLGGNLTTWDPLRSDPKQLAEANRLLGERGGLIELARSRVGQVASQLGITPSQEEINERGDVLLENFRTPFELFHDIVRHVLIHGWNLTLKKRANLCWDYEISFAASRTLAIDGMPVLLVTDDAAIHYAARDAGNGHCVRRFADHVAELELSERVEAPRSGAGV